MSLISSNSYAFRQKREDGFTLMEILVVIAITGVLSAIAFPVFMSQRKNAVDDMIKVDMQNIIKVIDSVRANNPNAMYITYKDKKVCAGSTAAPTTCPATSPTVKTESGATFGVAGGTGSVSGGNYNVSGWHPEGNKYNTQNTRLLYSSAEKVWKDCPCV